MNHLKWMGHAGTILEINRALREETQSCEVTLVAKDGNTVRAHRFVLSTCSDLMRSVLMDVPHGQECTMILPEINGILLESMLSFIYVGETSLPSSSLTEFLEAINLLGIKSAISFECSAASVNPNTAATATVNSDTLNGPTINVKSINGLQITQEDLIDEENGVIEKIDQTNNVISEHPATASSRELEFLDVYNEQQKITYSIEHMAGAGGGGEFILTENENTFTITQAHSSNKLPNETSSAAETSELVEEDNDGEDDSNIIEEEYNNTTEPLIEMTASSDIVAESATHIGDANIDSQLMEEAKSSVKLKNIKIKGVPQHHHGRKNDINSNNAYSYSAKSKCKAKNPVEVDNLEMAAQAVLAEGLSLQKAADKFDISKTVLWRRMRKDPAYTKSGREKPSLSLAYERLKSGDSLKNISKDLEIPMSTLHRHKVRLSQEGRLPQYLASRRRDSTPKDELQEKLAKAVHACIHEGMSQNHAANIFEIPKSTLWRHLRRRIADSEHTSNYPNSHTLDSTQIKEEVILS